MPIEKLPISATIITLNEERHIGRCIESVRAWVDDVVVVDSGSTDRTRAIAEEKGARFFVNPWKGYGQQKNFAQDQSKNDWVLNIDADEEVTPELQAEISSIFKGLQSGADRRLGFMAPRKSYYLKRWIRHGGWYPNYLVRFAHRKYARWTEPEVHEALNVDGEVGLFQSPLNHYTFDSIEDQVRTNLRFSRLGSKDLIRKGKRPSIMKLILKPIGKFFETYLIKRGFLDGIAGFLISINAAHSMFLKYAYLFEKDLSE